MGGLPPPKKRANHMSHLKFPKDKEAFIADAIKIASDIYVDQLDCKVSIARQPTEKTVDQVVQLAFSKPGTHFGIYSRRGKVNMWGEDHTYFEVSARVYGDNDIDYFLWIEIDDTPELSALFTKYNVTVN
jgi:hypothetical protein